MSSDLSTTNSWSFEALDEILEMVRASQPGSADVREAINQAVGLYLKQQSLGAVSADHQKELESLIGAQYANEIREAEENYKRQHAQHSTEGPEKSKDEAADP